MAIGRDRYVIAFSIYYGTGTHVPLHAQRLLRFASDRDGISAHESCAGSRLDGVTAMPMKKEQVRERERYTLKTVAYHGSGPQKLKTTQSSQMILSRALDGMPVRHSGYRDRRAYCTREMTLRPAYYYCIAYVRYTAIRMNCAVCIHAQVRLKY